MNAANSDVVIRRNLRRSACDLCREFKVKCSGGKPKCDRCTRLEKHCIFSTPLLPSRDARGSRGRTGLQDRFIHIDPIIYQSGAGRTGLPAPTDRTQSPRHSSPDQYRQEPDLRSTSPSPAPSSSSLPASVSHPPDQDALDPPRRGSGSRHSGETGSSLDVEYAWCWDGAADLDQAISRHAMGASANASLGELGPAVPGWSGSLPHVDRGEAAWNADSQGLSISTLRPSTMPRTLESRSQAVGLPAWEPCTCTQRLTASLFDLGSWSADPLPDTANAGYPTLSEFFTMHRNCMELWTRLTQECTHCLSQSQFAQLLILNIERLVQLQMGQQARRALPSSVARTPNWSETISFGNFMLESEAEKEALVQPMLKMRTTQLLRFVDTLHELLLAASVTDIGVRLNHITDKLTQEHMYQKDS